MEGSLRPVLVHASPDEAAELMLELLRDYQAELLPNGAEHAVISLIPLDDRRRGTVIYRVIQASRTVTERFPDSTLYLVTEDGSRWRLPPPALD
jgi:hypothetical protein